jgi:hypothetical protein
MMAATPAEGPIMPPPSDPVAAVTHPDPYPWYAALRQRPCPNPPTTQTENTLALWSFT